MDVALCHTRSEIVERDAVYVLYGEGGCACTAVYRTTAPIICLAAIVTLRFAGGRSAFILSPRALCLAPGIVFDCEEKFMYRIDGESQIHSITFFVGIGPQESAGIPDIGISSDVDLERRDPIIGDCERVSLECLAGDRCRKNVRGKQYPEQETYDCYAHKSLRRMYVYKCAR